MRSAPPRWPRRSPPARSSADDTVLAALLHDIGYWVLIQECPRELEQAVELALAAGISLAAGRVRDPGCIPRRDRRLPAGDLGPAVCRWWKRSRTITVRAV